LRPTRVRTEFMPPTSCEARPSKICCVAGCIPPESVGLGGR
jgi:hypothetical protein